MKFFYEIFQYKFESDSADRRGGVNPRMSFGKEWNQSE